MLRSPFDEVSGLSCRNSPTLFPFVVKKDSKFAVADVRASAVNPIPVLFISAI